MLCAFSLLFLLAEFQLSANAGLSCLPHYMGDSYFSPLSLAFLFMILYLLKSGKDKLSTKKYIFLTLLVAEI